MVSDLWRVQPSADGDLQCGEHVSGRNAVDAHTCVCPFDCERGRHVSDCSLRGVVRSLWLGDVDNGTTHGADHDNAARCVALHQVLGNTNSKEPCAVNIDAPQLLHAVVWVFDGWEVLGEAGGCDEVVDLAVLCDDLVQSLGDGLWL